MLLFLCVLEICQGNRSSGDEDNYSFTENNSEEEEDMSVLSGLDNYQLCLKYQQVLNLIQNS